MLELGYAAGLRCNDYRSVEKEIQKMTELQFIKRAKEIIKSNHPVRFVYLEHDKKGIVALYRDKQVIINKIWKSKTNDKETKAKTDTVHKSKSK